VLVYRANPKICNACPVKIACTSSKSGRHIFRSVFQNYLHKAEAHRQTEAYQKAVRKRSVWVEPLFGEAKEFHRLRRFRLRRLLKVNIEGVMVAAGQNLKRLLKQKLALLFCLVPDRSWPERFSGLLGLFQQPVSLCGRTQAGPASDKVIGRMQEGS
jgi:hypothetical protein